MSTLVQATTATIGRDEFPARWSWHPTQPWSVWLVVDTPDGGHVVAPLGRQALAAALAGAQPNLMYRADVRSWLDTCFHPSEAPVLRVELRAPGCRVTRIVTGSTVVAGFVGDTCDRVPMCPTPEHLAGDPQCAECVAVAERMTALLTQARTP